nr:hypothetical protein CTI12_AA077290 [Tanacetum cinerariifolium]
MTSAKNSYYGVVDEIWELDYTSVVIPLLKCKWVDHTRGPSRTKNRKKNQLNPRSFGRNSYQEANLYSEKELEASNKGRKKFCGPISRLPCDKNGIKTLPPELINVSNNLVQATIELAQGSNEPKAGVDPFILVLGPKHEGRTKGVECDIRYKKGIEGYVRKKRTYEQQKDIKEIQKEVAYYRFHEVSSMIFELSELK